MTGYHVNGMIRLQPFADHELYYYDAFYRLDYLLNLGDEPFQNGSEEQTLVRKIGQMITFGETKKHPFSKVQYKENEICLTIHYHDNSFDKDDWIDLFHAIENLLIAPSSVRIVVHKEHEKKELMFTVKENGKYQIRQ